MESLKNTWRGKNCIGDLIGLILEIIIKMMHEVNNNAEEQRLTQVKNIDSG